MVNYIEKRKKYFYVEKIHKKQKQNFFVIHITY